MLDLMHPFNANNTTAGQKGVMFTDPVLLMAPPANDVMAFFHRQSGGGAQPSNGNQHPSSRAGAARGMQQPPPSFQVRGGGGRSDQTTPPKSSSRSGPQPSLTVGGMSASVGTLKEDHTELLTRTIHLRFLPTTMKQGELAAMCSDCGPFNRVRICGGPNNNQNWIYGFVEFSSTTGAAKMMRKTGMELFNGAGKPPLRLKCHNAREPIVDRVFHDAEVAKGTPCLFGQGAFAPKTLREALESYHSLVSKAGSAQQLKDQLSQIGEIPVMEDSGANSGRTPTLPPSSPQTYAALPSRPFSLPAMVSPPPTASNTKVSTCVTFLDAAMRAGSAFAKSKTATSFFDAIGSLHALHEMLNTLSPSARSISPAATANGGGGLSVTDPQANVIRALRISAYLIATLLHILRGSLSEMLPCITKVMEVISAVSLELLEKPSVLQVADHDDDDEAFLNALSLVHVSQPSAVISQHTYDTAMQHQCFLVNSLLAIGFAVEGVNSLIARCAYTTARRRAASALEMRHPALDQQLRQGGVHELRTQMIGSGSSGEFGGDFASHFFTSYVDSHGAGPCDPSMPPPLHCVSVFPLRR